MTLQDDFNIWLLRLTLLAGGPSQTLGGHTTGNHDERIGPSGAPELDPQPWLDRWDRCYFTEDREELVEELQEKVVRFQHSSQGNVNKTLEWKIKVGRDPREAKTVAIVYGIGLSTVYKYRKEQKLREKHPDWPEDQLREVLDAA